MLPRLTRTGKRSYFSNISPASSSAIGSHVRIPLAGGPPELVLEGHGFTNLQCARLAFDTCLYSQVTRSAWCFSASTPLRGKGHEVAHIDDDLPYAVQLESFTRWFDSGFGQASKLDLSVVPDIRLLSLRDHSERTIRYERMAEGVLH